MSSDDKQMSDTSSARPVLTVQKIAKDAPWEWLANGWKDMWATPAISLVYGFVFFAVSVCLTSGLMVLDLLPLVLPLAAGFMLMGPLLAMGLYETSRRRARNETLTLLQALFVNPAAPAQLGFIGVVLMIVLLVWIRIATLLFAIFYGTASFPPFQEFVPMLLFTFQGLSLLAVGSVIGGILAFTIFAFSAISVPMLLDRDIDAITALIASVDTVRQNFMPMLLWAWLIAVLIGFGIATLFVGLIITFPLIGHATWHAYKSAIKVT